MNKQIHVLIFLLMLSGCAVWPSGEDPMGKELRAQANTIIEALVQYKAENGELPQSLSVLVPKYINELPAVANFSFYLKDKESLVYNYSPTWPQQGQTSCSTVIGSGKWGCHGYI